MKKLIIWDFDGTLVETETFYTNVWNELLNKYFKLNWSFNFAFDFLAGLSTNTKIEKFKKIGVEINSEFLNEIDKKMNSELNNNIYLTKDIENILSNNSIKHCVATGGTKNFTFEKIKVSGLGKYFNENNVFTADDVEKGKPSPDIFLLATNKMGFKSEECIAVEDSVNGVNAAIKAKIDCIVFTENVINKESFINWCKNNNISKFASNVEELKQLVYGD